MSDPRMARKGGQNGSKLLKVRDKYNSEATSFERHWEGHYIHFVRNNLTNLSESQFRDRLIAMANTPDARERVTQGLIFGLLTEPENTSKYFGYIGEIATDNWYSALCNINMILFEYFSKITDQAKNQIVNFFRLAIKANVAKIDNVIMNFVRYGSDGSDFGSRVRLIKGVVDMLSEKDGKDWILNLKGLSMLMPILLNVIVRLIVDMPQQGPGVEATRTAFLNFAFFIVARRLQCCLYLGRDLLLLLLRVSRTTQFAPLWRDLIKNPGQFGGAFKNVQDLLNRPPHNSIHPMKMSIPMQRQLEFMLITLRHGNHEKHVEWFIEWNFRAIDSSALRADVIRFVLSSLYHDKFNAEMRATIAYSMLTGCTPGPEMQWAKLMVWWDWFGFTMSENILPVEYAHSVLRMAINSQPVIGQTLLEFAMREITKMHPPLAPFFRLSFNNAFRGLTEKLGQSAVMYVLENARIDTSIRELCRNELHGKPSSGGGIGDRRGSSSNTRPPITKPSTSSQPANSGAERSKSMRWTTDPSSSSSVPPSVSTGNAPIRGIRKEVNVEKKEEEKKEKRMEKKKEGKEKGEKEIDDALRGLKGQLKTLACEMKNVFKDERCDEGEKCAVVQKVMEHVQENEDIHDDDGQLEHMGHLLGCLLRPLVPIDGTNLLPDKKAVDRLENEALSDCFTGPLYVVFRSLSLADSRSAIESIISWMREKDNAVTYLLLFFLKVYSEDSNLPSASYENVATHFESTLDSRLTEDLDLMALDDRRLFAFCLPFVFKAFPIVASGCIGLYRTFSHFADSEILSQFLGAVYREDITLFRKDSFNAIVQDSLEWEGIPEMIFWQLVHGDGVTAEWFYPLYTRVNSSKNPIAAAQLLILLKRHEPNTSIVRAVMSRGMNSDDNFTTSALKVMIEDEDSCSKTADIISTILKKQMSSGEILMTSLNSKNPKTKNSSNKLSMEHMFFHLTELSSRCLVKEKRMTELLLTTPSFREVVQSTRKLEKTSVLYSKFEKLFSFVEMLDEQRNTSRSLRGSRSVSSRGTKREAQPIEEETKKKKKPVYIVDSDSD